MVHIPKATLRRKHDLTLNGRQEASVVKAVSFYEIVGVIFFDTGFFHCLFLAVCLDCLMQSIDTKGVHCHDNLLRLIF